MFEPETINIPSGARYIVRILESHGYDTYVLFNNSPYILNISTSASTGMILALLAEHGIRTIENDLLRNTITACIGEYNYEISTFRRG